VQEFDLGSDADLVFVIPTRDAPEMRFWTRVAEKMIEVISAYTGEGSLFAVDTRLRPNGREGALVQTEQSIRDYFDSKAEAWEGMAYMKSHAVAGDKDRAVEFLNALQEVDWRRYGQSGRSRNDLRKMRQRLQKELGESNPLKAGEGGYYDIDFVLMYLRLKSAGIFFKQLNTPKRIDVVEKMGHLERAEAAFLMDAAVFYRAMDHGLRLIHGHAEGKLPRSQADLDALTALKRRWAPAPYRDRPLRAAVDEIRTRTRQVFDRLFP
jgi:glutamate-ammonia-ligase adenylyltransferase